MVIKNFDKLATSEIRTHALQILEAGYQAINTKKAINRWTRIDGDTLRIMEASISLGDIDRFVVVGIGKCAIDAATALEEILGDRISDGIVIDVRKGKLKYMRVFEGEHPYPTKKNVDATKELTKLLGGLTERDTVLMIISGGGSTLLCQPDNFTCKEEAELIKYFNEHGATIQEINTVRKHLSLARGGHLARHAYPARVISLIFSDVPGDDLGFVASGPTVKDLTTKHDAEIVLDKYSINGKSIFSKDNLMATPKDDKYFERVSNILFIDNSKALEAMAEKADELGLKPEVCTSCLAGEAREVGKNIVERLHRAKPNSVLLYGGETTVTVTHKGKGGRSTELALASVPSIEGGMVVVAAASDGLDNTDYAGAIVDIESKRKAHEKNIEPDDYLVKNRSYDFFRRVGDNILTGPTGSNVSDFVVAIKKH